MSEKEGGRLVSEIWRYVACCAITACVSLLIGQFIPNRNIATIDQLNATANRLESGQQSQQVEISALSTQVANLNGQLAAQHLISKTP